MLQCFSRFSVLVMAVSLLLVAMAGSAQANGGPPRISGDKGGVMLPGSTNQVHITAESLQFDVADDLRTADVTARYAMANRGGELRSFPVVFVWQNGRPGGQPPAVTWNGEPVASRQVETTGLTQPQLQQMAQAWSAMDSLIDPVTGQGYSDPEYVWSDRIGYLVFDLNMAASSTGTLEVRYRHTAAWDRTRYTHDVYSYQYLLLPAKGWASFGPLEIRVKAPGPERTFFASTLPLRWEGGEYRGEFPGLPEQNLAFSFMSRRGIIGHVAKSGPYYWFSFALVLVGAVLAGLGIGRLCGRLRSRAWAISSGLFAGIVGGGVLNLIMVFGFMALIPALSRQGYDYLFIGIGQWLVAMPLTAALAGIYAGKWQRRLSA